MSEINYNEDYTVAIANKLIKGRQFMTLAESKLLYIVISQVVQKDKDLKTYTTTIPELADFLGIPSENLYRDISKICRNLMSRQIEIKQDNDKWKLFQWISCCEYDSGTLTIKLSDEIKPYLISLEKYYSQYLLGTLIRFKSYYTSRLYQLIVCELREKTKGEVDISFTIEELREFFKIEKNKYKKPTDLLKRTIYAAQLELALIQDIDIIITEITENKAHKKGNPIESVTIRAEYRQ